MIISTDGASLFYVSAKEDKNCDLLSSYLQHRIYALPFTQNAYVVEKDCIFVYVPHPPLFPKPALCGPPAYPNACL